MIGNTKRKYILWFRETGIKDIELVGGKNASLGEMYRNLRKHGIRIPDGFSITSEAYRYFLRQNHLDGEIKKILKGLDTGNMRNLAERGYRVRQAILSSEFPFDLRNSIVESYSKLSHEYNPRKSFHITWDKKDHTNHFAGGVDVAVRSSATAEDLADASFAGQQESYLNVTGEYQLLESIKKCFSSLFTDRAISYRVDKGFDHLEIALSVGVQKMVRSDEASSGVMFTIDTESGFQDAIIINGSWGLGENIVKGKVNPDEFIVHKPTLEKKFRPIIGKKIGSKETKLVYSVGGGASTQNVAVSQEDQKRFCIADDEALELAKWGLLIEQHYKKPMDIEWAKDGRDKKLYIVQARPETVQSQREKNVLEEYILESKGKILCSGAAVGGKIGQGKANVIKDVAKIADFKKGEVLVTEMTDPDWEPIMKIASAIVTNSGGRTSHAAIVSRELGITCIVGTGNATSAIKDKKAVTVCCAEGEEGHVYEGLLKFKIKTTNLKNIKKSKTKIMMNVGNPDQAFDLTFIPNDGVGLAREEFIITEYIKIHPMALIHFEKVKEKEEKKKINELTQGYKNKEEFFVDKLAEGIGRICAAFWPKDVIVRMSDFKTNEYATLIGGKSFEPAEENPMIGWRGASRYYDEDYKEGFRLECLAFKKVRDVMGLTNLKAMIPFCRTVEEGKKVLAEMKKYGLKRGMGGLQVYVMCEIPSNVILASEFSKIFDGFSIGSNDLTQLTLGVDRDSAKVAHVYDERNDAVKELIRQVIAKAHRARRKVGICGQAPSDFVDFAQFLVKEKIDSISLNPDTVIKTMLEIEKMEK
ncbi:MAG: phosphoenolpyruvate synthase [Candidatus Moranbacteria bacterium RIFOXYB1_FULL_43_19]|nr:MAG: phosphoenolpyruvate synthase [Candidatus Moranbacteria bacterium RIFOXYB1_FULL_43_19]OGI32560.1 MAG: phosphoenolpyruvate synthase [Candidatus Moranbacteria bacterium RIFOXYC1_FULL_44_13]